MRLVAKSDVFVENLKSTTLHQMGIHETELLKANPRMIVLRLPPAGLSGDWAHYTGFGGQFDGLTGLAALLGHRGTTLMESPSTQHMDSVTGPAGAFATLAALHYRAATGRGQVIELAQSENVLTAGRAVAELARPAARARAGRPEVVSDLAVPGPPGPDASRRFQRPRAPRRRRELLRPGAGTRTRGASADRADHRRRARAGAVGDRGRARRKDSGEDAANAEHLLQERLRGDWKLLGLRAAPLREVPVRRPVGYGYIDLLGAGKDGRIRVIETKLGPFDRLVVQGLDYWIWATANAPDLAEWLDLPADAGIDIEYVVAEKTPGHGVIGSYTSGQAEAIQGSIRWRFTTIRDWRGSHAPTVERLPLRTMPSGSKGRPAPRKAAPRWSVRLAHHLASARRGRRRHARRRRVLAQRHRRARTGGRCWYTSASPPMGSRTT